MRTDQTQNLQNKDFILKWQGMCRYTWLGTLKSDGSEGIGAYSGKHNLIGTTIGQPGFHVFCKDTLVGFKGASQHQDEGRLVVVSARALHPAAGPLRLLLPSKVRIHTSASTVQPG